MIASQVPSYCSRMASSTQATSAVPVPAVNPPRAQPLSFGQRLAWFGGKVLDIAERVGEGVVSFLGTHLCVLSLDHLR